MQIPQPQPGLYAHFPEVLRQPTWKPIQPPPQLFMQPQDQKCINPRIREYTGHWFPESCPIFRSIRSCMIKTAVKDYTWGPRPGCYLKIPPCRTGRFLIPTYRQLMCGNLRSITMPLHQTTESWQAPMAGDCGNQNYILPRPLPRSRIFH